MECTPEQIYLSVYKQNSLAALNQKEESFNIVGVVDSTPQLLVQEKPLSGFGLNHTYEYCLVKTRNLVYELVLLDSFLFCFFLTLGRLTDGMLTRLWRFGRVLSSCYLKVTATMAVRSTTKYDVSLFPFLSVVTYLISPLQEWGVVAQSMSAEEFWLGISNLDLMLDPFDRDWLREDENAPDYDHYITGELTTDNLYYNRFVLGSEDTFAAVEIGVTNDFVDVMIYLNGIEVYSETDHQSNGRNYYRCV